VNLVKEGAYQFLTKPLYPDLILETIENAFLERGQAPGIKSPLRPKEASLHYIKGESPAALKLFEHVNLVGPTDYSVIIHGETGTGKEALARFLHQVSSRKDKPFVAIDCGSLSKHLAASELFGYKKGAFTGAAEDKKGAFEIANGGTIFLDEIGNLSSEVQMLLLRALQEKIIRKVGDVEEKKVNVRVIVASNESLPELTRNRQFREDLYHRLNEFTLEVPPLRARTEDLPLFISEFIKQSTAQLGKNIKGLSPEAENLFRAYHWPGNIRELQNVIKRACLLTPADSYIGRKSLPLEMVAPETFEKSGNNNLYLAEKPVFSDMGTGLREVTLEAERHKILKVLQQVNYNKTKAAALLDIDRKTLYNKLKEMGSLNDNLHL
jgi:two-component system response regulator HydG